MPQMVFDSACGVILSTKDGTCFKIDGATSSAIHGRVIRSDAIEVITLAASLAPNALLAASRAAWDDRSTKAGCCITVSLKGFFIDANMLKAAETWIVLRLVAAITFDKVLQSSEALSQRLMTVVSVTGSLIILLK
eukprot:CAMPEP_0115061332 /NCGR_PEP_ID=MMETSP0227-20121206/7946_1 /TAXON_ID=89957 /ORGANISM="Polarella glacialis, Strain CCMP 1383" /LENGTH=135 /DNA_ID=CAMNT_0002446617 /DNA_START=746 /DNA_END=1153 /DNA_ORIENTATION=+